MTPVAPEPLVDAHHHLWDTAVLPYRGSPSPSRYLLADFLHDAEETHLTHSVHLQAEVERDHSVEETRWVQAIADEHGLPSAIVAYADLSAPDVERTLEAHAVSPRLRGIRQILNWDPDPAISQCDRSDYLTDPAWRAGYATLARHGLSFDLQVFPRQMAAAAEVAAANPGTLMIVNHAGMPRLQEPDGWEQWRRGMRVLREHPNVVVKLSGFGMFDRAWTDAMVRPYVLETIDLFGVDRCLFASNFPVDRPARPYAEVFAAFSRLVEGCTGAERGALFHDNAVRIYRLDAAADGGA